MKGKYLTNMNIKRNKKIKNKGRIGLSLNIIDKNDQTLSVGDEIQYNNYHGILLYNYHSNRYGIALDYSKWYGDDKYDIDSYGQFIEIPMDNGAKMEIEKVNNYVNFRTLDCF